MTELAILGIALLSCHKGGKAVLAVLIASCAAKRSGRLWRTVGSQTDHGFRDRADEGEDPEESFDGGDKNRAVQGLVLEALGLRQQLEVIRAQLGNCRLQIDTMDGVIADWHRDKEPVIAEVKQKAGEVENMKGLLEGKARDLEAADQKVDMVAGEGKGWEEKIRNSKAEQELAQLEAAVEEKQDREQQLLKELDRVKKEAADRLSQVREEELSHNKTPSGTQTSVVFYSCGHGMR
ncbi:hypothetical protein CBR_g30960 [Chara braunii]|uniref:Uncharacterized protein n=1 Tax=Chara braunii TaxID=69332 RepID=A0A388LDW4_CHABU|nr:hypothetical protein CBR_g30960 [Chara braunii]|eukprot:GBG80499.1 hypothetical protein CBR_g30960 [Chara braunii]